MLHHPYESFDAVVHLLEQAADDPAVLAIKMTLYRVSRESPIVAALGRAAEAGKQVTVLVEVKARFDEERNLERAALLERQGAIVVYGIAWHKVHAKALLIVRRESDRIRRYVHLGTGNYRDDTARLYTDIGLLTAEDELAMEVGVFFNTITGYSTVPNLRRLAMAPIALKQRLLAMIEREAARPPNEQPLIMAKLNQLTDRDVIDALYAASRAGVTIKLNVRGDFLIFPPVAQPPGQITWSFGQTAHLALVWANDQSATAVRIEHDFAGEGSVPALTVSHSYGVHFGVSDETHRPGDTVAR